MKSSKEQYVYSFNRIIAFSEFILKDIYGFLNENSKSINIDDPNLFVIEGFSALKEYLVYAPTKIVSIVAHKRQHVKINEN